MKILLTGGGTGGHIIPLLAVVSELEKICAQGKIAKTEFMLITTTSGFNKNISNAGIRVKIIKAGKLRRYFSLENLIDMFKIPVGIIQSLYYINQFKPDVVFSKGGFASVPPVMAARILKIPILTHESDVIPGLANKIISFFATKIFVSFEDTKSRFPNRKVIVTGNPVRKDIFNGNKEQAMVFFGFKENIPTVLIFGGSQGAQKLNEVILKSLSDILKKCQVIHICGIKSYEDTKKTAQKLGFSDNKGYKVYSYLNEKMKDAFALADVVVARAGANSLAEIIALAKPSIIIPLSTSANNHQLQNAEFFAKKGIITAIKEDDLSPDNLTNEIFSLLPEKGKNVEIKENMRKYNLSTTGRAVEIIAKEIMKLNSH